jgi:hypothetical protein
VSSPVRRIDFDRRIDKAAMLARALAAQRSLARPPRGLAQDAAKPPAPGEPAAPEDAAA